MTTAADIIALRIRNLELEALADIGGLAEPAVLRDLARRSPWRKASDADLITEREYLGREIALADSEDADSTLGLRLLYDELLAACEGEVARRARLGLAVRQGAAWSAEWLLAVRAAAPLKNYLEKVRQMAFRASGRGRWVARCPFHPGDRTPSFTLFEDERGGHWQCFGCNQGGDIFAFVRRHPEGPEDFPGAVRAVAAYAGVEIPRSELQGIEVPE